MDKTAKVSRESTTAGQMSIEVANLEKHFGSTKVLDQLSLNVERGELLVVLGDSGCGKSTLLKLIAGLDQGQRGTIRINGAEQARVPPHKRDIAMVFQDGNGYEHLTVRENLELAAKKATESCMERWVDWLKLGTLLSQKLASLSGGELQRVAIARAMISSKSIVLLDEPLAHLNQSLREEIRDLIFNVHCETDKTFIYVTHDSEEAFYLADRIAVLADGKIQQIGCPRTIYLSSNSKRVARMLGQPGLDIIRVPCAWVGLAGLPSDAMVDIGSRSHNWKIQRIEAEKKDVATSDSVKSEAVSESYKKFGLPNELAPTETGLTVRGWISSCRWLGSKWLLELNCPCKIRITCESPAPGPIEQVLRLSADAFSEKPKRTAFCYLEATIERSCLQVFTD